jgi:hypothetical protein
MHDDVRRGLLNDVCYSSLGMRGLLVLVSGFQGVGNPGSWSWGDWPSLILLNLIKLTYDLMSGSSASNSLGLGLGDVAFCDCLCLKYCFVDVAHVGIM